MQEFSLEWFFTLVIFILPAYVANSSPVYFDPGRRGKKDTPIDFGVKFIDGRELISPNKGLEGMVAGILFGTFIGFLIAWLGFTPLGFTVDQWAVIALFESIGAQFGDKLGSFIKRRLALKGGERFEYFDQLGFIVFALAFAAIANPLVSTFIGPTGFIVLVIGSYFVHRGFSVFGFWIGLKKVPY